MTAEDLRMLQSHWLEQYWNAGLVDPKLLAKDFAYVCETLADLADEHRALAERVEALEADNEEMELDYSDLNEPIDKETLAKVKSWNTGKTE